MPVDTFDYKQQEQQRQFNSSGLSKYQHNSVDLHMIGESIGAPSRVTQVVLGASNRQIGISPFPAREDHIHSLDTFSSAGSNWTPVLSGTTTNPVLGSGSIQAGWFIQADKLVFGQGQITFGSSGASFGSGFYKVNLPVPCRYLGGSQSVEVLAGTAWIFDTSANVSYICSLRPTSTTAITLVYHGGPSTGASPTLPMTWQVSDSVFYAFVYEAA